MSDLERELESELHRVLDPMSAAPIPPRRTVHGRGTTRALLKGAGAAFTIKLLTGVAVAAAAVTVAGVATTGSLNPTNWGEMVTTQVSNCKAHLTDGQHGIGDCVSDFSNQHGASVASAARHHGKGDGDGNATPKGNGNGTGHTKDKAQSRPPAGTKGQSDATPTPEPEAVDQAGTHQPVRITPQP